MAELKWKVLIVVLSITITLADDQPACGQNQPIPKKYKVRDKLLCSYDKNVRPVAKPEDIIQVLVIMSAIFIDIDETEGETILHAWTYVSWNDSYLTWDTNANDNIRFIEVDASQIWTPDLYIPNRGGASDSKTLLTQIGPCKVRWSGEVFCAWRTVLNAVCNLDYTNWPFDTQVCRIRMALWSHTTEEVNITHGIGNVWTAKYEPSKTWDLIDTRISSRTVKISANVTLPRLNFYFTLKRHSAIFVAVLAIPVLCAIVITLMPYLMEPNRPQRLLLAAAAVAVNALLLLGIGEHMWHYSSTVPHIVCFYRDSMYIVVLSLVVSLCGRLLMSLQPPGWLTSGSQRVLDIWNNYSVFVRIQKPVESPEAVSPAKDYWTRFMTFVDGFSLVISCLVYIILIGRSLLS